MEKNHTTCSDHPALTILLLASALLSTGCTRKASGSTADQNSAQASSYKDALPTEGWVPGKQVGEVAGIRLMGGRRFKLRSAATGREAVAVARTSLAPSGGVISAIYMIDGVKLISITARTQNEGNKAAFLESLTLLR